MTLSFPMDSARHISEPVHSGPNPESRSVVEVADAVVRFGPRSEPVLRSVSFAVAPGETLALVGPSGSGKTTLLRVVAGLQRLDAGSVRLDGRLVDGPTFVPPERRGVGLVFQDGALFPHQTVAHNVGFGVKDSSDRARRVDDLLDLLDISELAHRRPDTLSGGQRQRVALARALAPEPKLLLMDEPFSALDAGLRGRVRRDVAGVLATVGIAAVFVTHDQGEALSLGDRVGVLQAGLLAQIGTPDDVYGRPASPEVAEFVGEGSLIDATVRGPDSVESAVGWLPAHAAGLVTGSSVLAMVRPELFELVEGDDATVVEVESDGAEARYRVAHRSGVDLVVRMLRPRFVVGDRVGLRLVGGPVAVWPAT